MTDEVGAIRLEDIGGPNTERLMQSALGWMAANKEQFRNANSASERSVAAQKALHWAMQAVGLALGPDIIRQTYGPGASTRHQAMHLIMCRLMPLQELYKGMDTSDSFDSINAVRRELLNLAYGDEPRLFARLEGAKRKGLGVSANRSADRRLRLLEWQEFVKCHSTVKIPLGEFRSWIKHGFDSSQANAWKKDIMSKLGKENVDLAMSFAGDLHMLLPLYYTQDDIEAAVRADVVRWVESER